MDDAVTVLITCHNCGVQFAEEQALGKEVIHGCPACGHGFSVAVKPISCGSNHEKKGGK